MREDPDRPTRRRRRDIISIGLVFGYAWSLACLVLAQDIDLTLLLVLPVWLAGLSAIGGTAAIVIGGGNGQAVGAACGPTATGMRPCLLQRRVVGPPNKRACAPAHW